MMNGASELLPPTHDTSRRHSSSDFCAGTNEGHEACGEGLLNRFPFHIIRAADPETIWKIAIEEPTPHPRGPEGSHGVTILVLVEVLELLATLFPAVEQRRKGPYDGKKGLNTLVSTIA